VYVTCKRSIIRCCGNPKFRSDNDKSQAYKTFYIYLYIYIDLVLAVSNAGTHSVREMKASSYDVVSLITEANSYKLSIYGSVAIWLLLQLTLSTVMNEGAVTTGTFAAAVPTHTLSPHTLTTRQISANRHCTFFLINS
jgi:predicted secreted protein